MTDKDHLHALVDELPQTEIPAALRYLELLVGQGEDPVAKALACAPDDDEAVEASHVEVLREALADIEAGRTSPHAEVATEALKSR